MKQTHSIEKMLAEFEHPAQDARPVIFDLSNQKDRERFVKLFNTGRVAQVVDQYRDQLKELFEVNSPALAMDPNRERAFTDFYNKTVGKQPLWQHGRWVWYPWASTITHILEDGAFQTVRTARNKYLITPEEQGKYYNTTIGIAGLSIGNSVALAVAIQGGGKSMRLADFDQLSLSNTNRIRTGTDNLGVLKTEMTARQIYLVNPYARVDIFSEGLNKKNIRIFFNGPPRLDVVVDEIDDLEIKYLIREEAKRQKVAVIMGVDNGEQALVDVERFDIDRKVDFFRHRMGELSYGILRVLSKQQVGEKIAQYIGGENISNRMRKSLSEIGKTVVTWPQLGGTALLNGSVIAHLIRLIVCGKVIRSGRRIFSISGANE